MAASVSEVAHGSARPMGKRGPRGACCSSPQAPWLSGVVRPRQGVVDRSKAAEPPARPPTHPPAPPPPPRHPHPQGFDPGIMVRNVEDQVFRITSTTDSGVVTLSPTDEAGHAGEAFAVQASEFQDRFSESTAAPAQALADWQAIPLLASLESRWRSP